MSSLRYIYDYDALAYRVERRTGKQWELVAICNTEQEAIEFIEQYN